MVTLTPAELAGLTGVAATVQLTSSGTIALSGKTIGPQIILANGNTTLDLTGAVSAGVYTGHELLAPYSQSFGFVVTCGTGNYTITGSATVRSWIQGGSGNDIIHAGDGGAEIDGGGGLDQLYGGAGDDDFLLRDESFGNNDPGAPELAGTIIDGGGGTNTLHGFNLDLSQLVLSNIQHISVGQATMNISQLAGVNNLYGAFTFVGSGTADLSGIQLGPTNTSLTFAGGIDVVDLSHALADDVTVYLDNAGTVFTGGSAGYSEWDNAGGPVTIISGSGAGHIRLGASGGTVHDGSGHDTVDIGGGLVNISGAGAAGVSVYIDFAPTSGSVISGGTGNNSVLYIDTIGVDLSGDTISGFSVLDAEYRTTLNQAAIDPFVSLTGSYVLKGSGTLNFSGKELTNFTLALDPAGGSVDFSGALISGFDAPGVTVTGGTNGANSIIGTAGNDTIDTSGLGDVIEAGAGDDGVYITTYSGLVTGAYDGGSGNNILYDAGTNGTFDISKATITGFATFDFFAPTFYAAPVVTLTIAQLAEFTNEISAGVMTLVDGGAIAMAGVIGGNTSFQLSDTATTLDLRVSGNPTSSPRVVPATIRSMACRAEQGRLLPDISINSTAAAATTCWWDRRATITSTAAWASTPQSIPASRPRTGSLKGPITVSSWPTSAMAPPMGPTNWSTYSTCSSRTGWST